MKTLEEFNEVRRELWTRELHPCPNGILCPRCEDELWDTEPAVTLTTNPPQKYVHCPECGWRGTRVA